jgi:prophage antirepressor-like protein
MKLDRRIQIFDDKQIRTFRDSEQEKWFVSITDVIAVLTESIDPNAYWRKLKQRLKVEENETVTNCNGLKMLAADGKMRMTDVADSGQIFRLIQSIPSPKAEPFKLWLAKVDAERYNHLKNREWQHQNTGATQRK